MPKPTLIYNLFPPLFGPIPVWEEHLDRIADMGFTWIYLNPINTPGLSGSLYAVKDYYAINPLFLPASGEDPEKALVRFLKAAERRNIRVMLDLVFNHTAIDSPLTVQHRDWFAVDEDGHIKNPSAIDPADTTKITVWGDLAELEYWPPTDPEGLRHFWDQVISYYLRLGFTGFRADAAYKVPGDFWGLLIGEARAIFPEVRFFAETLGCRLSELGQLRTAGFDFIYNSSKWWDFQADWCLDQYNRFRHLAPSISFPESHDTDRLAKESGGSLDTARQRYLFAAFFSTGLMITSGFEYGFQKKLNVVKTRPKDWEEKHRYDLGTYISQVNRMKKNCPVLLEEGPMVRLEDGGKERPVTCLVKSRKTGRGRVMAVINTTGKEQQVKLPNLAESLGQPPSAWEDLTPDMIPLRLTPSLEFALAPQRARLFYNPQGEPLPEPELQPVTEDEKA